MAVTNAHIKFTLGFFITQKAILKILTVTGLDSIAWIDYFYFVSSFDANYSNTIADAICFTNPSRIQWPDGFRIPLLTAHLTREVDEYQNRKGYVPPLLFYLWYFSFFPIRMLVGKQTTAKFFKNSYRNSTHKSSCI